MSGATKHRQQRSLANAPASAGRPPPKARPPPEVPEFLPPKPKKRVAAVTKAAAKQAGAPTCSRHVLASTVVSNGARHCARRSRYFRVRQLVAVLVVIDHLLRNLTFGHPPGRMRVSTVTNVSKRRGYHRDNPVSNRRLPSRSPRSRRSRRAAPPARRRTRRRCSASASRR